MNTDPEVTKSFARYIFTEANVVVLLHSIARYLEHQRGNEAERLLILTDKMLANALENIQNRSYLEYALKNP